MLGIPIVTQFNGTGIKKAVASFKQLDSATAKAKFALKALAVTGAAAVAALGTAAFQAGQKLFEFARMARDDEKAQLQLAASIRASTKATDEQIAGVEQMIDRMQRQVGIADDELRPAYARLIRSTRDFDKAQRLLKVALDVSAGTGKPLKAVTEALGKAYDGNNTALARLGLGYDKAKLKAMDFDDVQKDLEKRFSGAALDQANTYEGVMARFSITLDELKETLGMALLPYFKKLAEYGIQIADAFGRDGVAGAFKELQYILKTLIYDENGQLNQAGRTINDLIGKLNFVIKAVNAVSAVGQFAPSTFLLQRFTNTDLTPSFGQVAPLATGINPGSLRSIRGQNTGVNITVQTGIGDPVQIGRQVYNTLNALERRRGGR